MDLVKWCIFLLYFIFRVITNLASYLSAKLALAGAATSGDSCQTNSLVQTDYLARLTLFYTSVFVQI